MQQKNYNQYSTEDFLEDKDFLRHIKYRSVSDTQFWENWIDSKPENLPSYQRAKLQLGILLSDPVKTVPEKLQVNLLHRINQSIDADQQKRKSFRLKMIWAGSVAASLLIAIPLIWYTQSVVIVQTGYGENKMVTLPDGSKVTLNANSSISYARAFNWKMVREVKLQGEGFFNVKHLNHQPSEIKDGEIFLATTSGVKVQVLGTEFNLRERHNIASVALVKGKVQITSRKSGTSYILKPGEFLSIDAHGRQSMKQNTIETTTAWTGGNLKLYQTTVKDILQEFEDLYGYTVVMDSAALGNKKIDGTISIKNEESLLFTLSNILNVDIKKKGKTIYLKNRH